MIIRAFITHKQAELFSDCQDRFGVNVDTKSIAVSDGMGATWQQKIWAQLLVDEFVGSNNWLPDSETIKPLCLKWQKEVGEFIQNLKDTNAPEYLINMNERSLAEGRSAGATFVGIRFNGKEWSGSVLGDSCLIEWNGHEAKFHTSQDRDTFDNFPDYFDSDILNEGRGTPKAIKGILSSADSLFLVSDPFSDFLLEHCKQDGGWRYISQLLGISSHNDFEMLVDRWRKEGMHNDDTTLVIVDNDDTDDFILSKELDDIHVLIEKEVQNKEKTSVDVIKQVISSKELVDEKTEKVTDMTTNSLVSIDDIIDEFANVLKEKRDSTMKPKTLMGWFRTIRNLLKEVLEKYTIIKK